MSDAVLYAVNDEGIATITINRPEQRNCLSKEVRDGLFAAWGRFEQDASARIAILTGSGEKAFCAGGDLKEMVETGLKVPPRDMFPVPYETIKLSKPTIAAVNGVAFAGGWMIAQGCDLCVASTTAKFASSSTRPAAKVPVPTKAASAPPPWPTVCLALRPSKPPTPLCERWKRCVSRR